MLHINGRANKAAADRHTLERTMPTFNSDLPDEISEGSVPNETIVGRLRDETTVAEFVSAVGEAGIEGARIHVFTGPEGADIIGNLGTAVGRFFGPDRREPIELLQSGTTLIAVLGVDGSDQDRVATIITAAGAKVMRRFGRWTYS